MMDDAIDDAMDTGVEEEGDEIVEQVMEELGVDLNQAVSPSADDSLHTPALTRRSSSAILPSVFKPTRPPRAE